MDQATSNAYFYPDPANPTISEPSRAWLAKRRETPGWGHDGFDLEALRNGMGTRREPTEIAYHSKPAEVGGIPGEWVWVDGADDSLRLLYIHGGGFVSGSADFYVCLAARLAAAAGCVLFLVNYRLAPEYPYPAGLDDCVAAYEGIRHTGPHDATSARAVFVAGDSAGGGLTVSTLLRLREGGIPMPDAAIPISPFGDHTLSGESLRSEGGLDPIMHPGCVPGFVPRYIGEADPNDPLVSPIFADFDGLPPLLIQVGEHEIIRDDSVRIAARAQEAGVPVTLEIWGGMWHVFQGQEPPVPESYIAIDRIAAFMRAHTPA